LNFIPLVFYASSGQSYLLTWMCKATKKDRS